jgi:hypothetical protein
MGSTRKDRSRSRNKRPSLQPQLETGAHRSSNFVIPLAGILSSVAARFYDMGGTDVIPKDTGNGRGNERTPLLPQAKQSPEGDGEPTARKTRKWFATNAVAVYVTLLIAAVITMLCVFFGGKFEGSPRSTYYILRPCLSS